MTLQAPFAISITLASLVSRSLGGLRPRRTHALGASTNSDNGSTKSSNSILFRGGRYGPPLIKTVSREGDACPYECGKRSTVREFVGLLLPPPGKGNGNGNVPPGTVAGRGIAQPGHLNFFLVSAQGVPSRDQTRRGTSRSAGSAHLHQLRGASVYVTRPSARLPHLFP